MNKLDTSNWKYFSLGDKRYFKIYCARGKVPPFSSDFFMNSSSFLPVVSSSKENNGITAFYKREAEEQRETYRKNLITIANNGSVGESFFQPWEFCSTNDVTICELVGRDLNENLAFFLISVFKMEKFRYSYGKKWNLSEMRNSKIFLPQNEKGEPDWDWMISLNYLRQREREREQNINICPNNWKEFKISDYFYTSRAKITKKEDILPGEFSHITDKNAFNGYEGFSHLWTEERNVISIGTYSGSSFYQEKNFVNSSHQLIKIWPKTETLNKYKALFLNTILNQGASKYSYGRMRSLAELKKEKILLPIDKNKEIDWEFMESTIKNLQRKIADNFKLELVKIYLLKSLANS